MNDLDKALADIVEIKSRLAQSSEFLGLGPAALRSEEHTSELQSQR